MAFDKSQGSYEALRNIIGERTDSIVFWIGSGPSVEVGLPSWSYLRTELTKTFEEQIRNLDSQETDLIKNSQRALNFIRNEQDNWVAFERLRSGLGKTTWQSRIRELLTPPGSVATPPAYQKMWKLRPHGILTVNLDRLIGKAYAEMNPELLTEFVGKQIADHTLALKDPRSFICHLHGKFDDASSWIITNSDLREAKNSGAYGNFIKTCLSAKTVVFIGISADDEAVGGFAEQLTTLGIDTGSHYWITDRRDSSTHDWAEDQNIRLVQYNSPNENHSELLEILDDLIAYVSVDDPKEIRPVSPIGVESEDLPLPYKDELLRMDEEEIRKLLNSEASRILDPGSPGSIEEYNKFSQDYDQAIYRAWYTSTDPGSNQLLGNTLHEEAARGAFGKVYRASDSNGKEVAVKILHESIRQNPELFKAFRRGVRSMEILRNRQVEGMVPYRKASEIPACVVMDWIDGPSLNDAVASNQIRDWELILRISSDITNIIRRGHALPERVLHRDIRPSNVMLRGFYSDPNGWDVVVLDFDLSWHRGALDKSVAYGSTTFGYLAPEQIQDIQGVSTRHAAVDSFGIGMVLFFMIRKKDPVPDEHRHVDWKKTLNRAAKTLKCIQWRSLPARYSRLIEYATHDNQSDRWDMTQIQAELNRLHAAVLNPTEVQSTELIAEEIAARCNFCEDYKWANDTLSAIKETASGVRVEVQGDESQRKIFVKIRSPSTDRWNPRKMETVKEMLESRSWKIETFQENGSSYIDILASFPANLAISKINEAADSLELTLGQLRF